MDGRPARHAKWPCAGCSRSCSARAALHGLLLLSRLLSNDGFEALLLVVVAMDWAERRAPAVATPRWLAVGLALAAWYGARVLGLPSFGAPAPDVPLALSGLFLETARIYSVRAIVLPPPATDHPYTSAGSLGLAIVAAVPRPRSRGRLAALLRCPGGCLRRRARPDRGGDGVAKRCSLTEVLGNDVVQLQRAFCSASARPSHPSAPDLCSAFRFGDARNDGTSGAAPSLEDRRKAGAYSRFM
jgi:hypothetical protein